MCLVARLYFLYAHYISGADPGFSFREGAKDYVCAHAHHERKAQSPLCLGSRVRFRALEALGGFDALSCYLSLICMHSDTKWDLKQHSQSNVRGGGGGVPVVPSSKSATITLQLRLRAET